MALTRRVKASMDLSADTATPPFEVTGLENATISATWTGLAALTSTMVVQASVDGVGWNDIKSEDNRTTLDTTAPDNVQIWEILEITAPFLRLQYVANTNTAGTAAVEFFGSNRTGGGG